MARSQRSDATETGGRSPANRLLGVGRHRETYATLLCLLAGVPLGIDSFSVLVTGLGLGPGPGTGLVPVGVGITTLVGGLAVGGCVGLLEAALLSRLRGRDVSVTPADPTEQSPGFALAVAPPVYRILGVGGTWPPGHSNGSRRAS